MLNKSENKIRLEKIEQAFTRGDWGNVVVTIVKLMQLNFTAVNYIGNLFYPKRQYSKAKTACNGHIRTYFFPREPSRKEFFPWFLKLIESEYCL